MQPIGYAHSLALLEAAEYCANLLKSCGHESTRSKNRLIHDGINIIFGAHINPDRHKDLPKNVVIFNTEQLPESGTWVNEAYREILANNFVWDYSHANFPQIPHNNKTLIEFYYDHRLCRIPIAEEKQWDLLFYGSINERRKNILDGLASKGLKIKTVFGVYGAERDLLIGQSHAVLNLHFYDSQIFQQIRIFYPLINEIPVISENYPEDSAPDIYKSSVFTPGNLDFDNFVVGLLNDKSLFKQLSTQKFLKFKSSENNTLFNEALVQTLKYFDDFVYQAITPIEFKKINLGSGKDYRREYLNIDLRSDVCPDILFDLSQEVSFPVRCESNLYGTITLHENQIDEIIANDVLEHVPNLEMLMGNCLRLLNIGGKFIINVPYDLSYGAWQDPTHIRAFNQNSWLYYTDWFWYLGWFSHKFDLVELQYLPSSSGHALIKQNVNQDVILTTPRAIDSMRVILVKRETTYEEKTLARSYSNNW
jgi:SAM-dependent methyltransferase